MNFRWPIQKIFKKYTLSNICNQTISYKFKTDILVIMVEPNTRYVMQV